MISYEVLCVGNTSREPLVGTVPIPWFNVAPVAFFDDHFSVADPPRSIELGSADSVTSGCGGGAGSAGFGGGGGGGGGGGFLQPALNATRKILNTTSEILLLVDMELLCLLKVLFHCWNYLASRPSAHCALLTSRTTYHD